ncbi:MAG: glycosyltransferase [Patescibacteria group bacterium]
MITNNIQLSYLVITKNKLPYLKNRLERLFSEKLGDEEVLVADGHSTDGTKEYIDQLKKDGKISYCISENDVGIAQALNKLALVARGTLITSITDDDVFHYPTILDCKNFMLQHPQTDVVFTNGGIKNRDIEKSVRPLIYHPYYERWQKDRTPFTATDLGMMFRRASISLIGLWNTSFPAPDAEFVFRIMTSKANVAWCKGFSFINVSNAHAVSLSHMKQIKLDMDKLNKYYLDKNPDPFIIEKLKIIRNKWRSKSLFQRTKDRVNKKINNENPDEWLKLISVAEKWLDQKYLENKPAFLWNKI